MISNESRLRLPQALLFVVICAAVVLVVGCSHSVKGNDQVNHAEPTTGGSALYVKLVGIDDGAEEIEPAVLSIHGKGGGLIASGIEVPADGAEHEVTFDSENDALLRVMSSPVFQDGAYYAAKNGSSLCFWLDKASDGWELSQIEPAPEGVEVAARPDGICMIIDFSKQEKAALSVAALSSMVDDSLSKSEFVVTDLQRISEQTELDEFDTQTLERNKLKVAALTVLNNRLSSIQDSDVRSLAKFYRDFSAVDQAVAVEEVPSFSE